MYGDTVAAVGTTAKNKVNFMKNNLGGFFLMAMMAGLYIGLGSVLMLVVGAAMKGQPAQKLLNGLVFSVGLPMVMMAGSELFTGNNLVMSVGAYTKNITWAEAIRYWVICWLGNLVGSFLVALVFTATGIPAANDYAATVAAGKIAGTPLNLFTKAVFCNICVCIAIWCGTKLKSEGAKIAMAVFCVVTFVTCGFEHSVANMTFLNIGLLNQAGVEGISIGGICYNLLIVTLGNIVGGAVCVGLPYYLTGRKQA